MIRATVELRWHPAIRQGGQVCLLPGDGFALARDAADEAAAVLADEGIAPADYADCGVEIGAFRGNTFQRVNEAA